ncbi:MAG: hypothetical protein KKG88_02515 [Proteobacteria bacterium]|nr:hypothetical protein [Pseudomonadota bacterium]MDP2003989.1 hypothetical protein [Desulfurivibrionaceae bacterium]PKN22995.1 MAG: hypothetical protein CVU68_02425 [Deltaproteobacteria bacterium HGW-Deltaproteobacteria-3]MBU4229153.1 hypothetical protein [Pseudomonadota bacterium]MBU4408601.1 hypothetical protein [Pseudomonadota bacterium]
MAFFELSPIMAERIADLYSRMEKAYDLVARRLDFTCDGCPDNCCDSYFLHHTYVEWGYLWVGLMELAPERRKSIENRAAEYAAACEKALAREERPQLMCPLNEEGRCSLYLHRLMICRMHGVPSSLTFPNGQTKKFPGCFRCQEIVGGRQAVPSVERASLLRELVAIEQELLGEQQGQLPKLKKTIAEMILSGPPRR